MSYKNPVISIKGLDHGDPAVVKHHGVYYLYHTGPREIPVYQSTNLVDWEAKGVALYASDDPSHWAQVDLWAPEVMYADGLFYMYVTGAVRKADGSGDDEIRRIGVATSVSPLGPFKLEDEPLTDEWSIDAHPFKDEDGQMYLFYNVRNDYTRGPNGIIGTGNVVDRMVDYKTLSGQPTMVVKPEHAWEGNKEGSFFWNEGPFVLKRDGTYYQMYSAGFFGDDTYGVYFATSDVPMGSEGMNDSSWSKWGDGTPILKTNQHCDGPGHHVVVKGPNGIEDFIVYHGYEPGEELGERRVRVGRLYWEEGRIKLEEPSDQELAEPTPPTFDGRFHEDMDEINNGLEQHRAREYFFETNVTLEEPMEGDVFYKDDTQFIAFRLDAHSLTLTVVSGEHESNHEYELQSNVQRGSFYPVQISKGSRNVTVFFDGLLIAELTHELLEAEGIVRLKTTSKVGTMRGTVLTVR